MITAILIGGEQYAVHSCYGHLEVERKKERLRYGLKHGLLSVAGF